MPVDTARVARHGAWQRLAAVIGNPDMPPGDVAGDAARDLPLITFDAALSRLLSEHPQLAAKYAEIERARWAVSRARAEVVPNLSLQASVQYDNATNDTIAGVQMGLPIPILNRNQGGIQQAQGELAAARGALGRLELALRKRLATVFQQYLMAKQQVDRYVEDILPKVDETLRLTTEGYRAEEFNFLQLLTAQRTYFQTHLAYLNALGSMWAASREIDGLLLSDSLESGSSGQ
jgi:cobalt-zinc-cadmium efflux system outer membrane protein